jgi:hypothetical protein
MWQMAMAGGQEYFMSMLGSNKKWWVSGMIMA